MYVSTVHCPLFTVYCVCIYVCINVCNVFESTVCMYVCMYVVVMYVCTHIVTNFSAQSQLNCNCKTIDNNNRTINRLSGVRLMHMCICYRSAGAPCFCFLHLVFAIVRPTFSYCGIFFLVFIDGTTFFFTIYRFFPL